MKTPGQVGYEAMLELIRENKDIPGYQPPEERDAELEMLSGSWENQNDKLKAGWEHVAQAIVAWERDRFLGVT